MSSRSNPFEEMERLFERMSRQFEEASHKLESESPLGGLASGGESMAIDLVEHDDEFVVTADLPGFEREDVEIRMTDHTLRIDASHEESIDEEDEEYIRHERRQQSVRRSIRLPGEVDTDNVTATMQNGVLTLTLPRRESEKGHTIEIE
ncbi:archaeal heat shock protein Hsp14 [Haloarculaceae archaeon H-GB11]|nr:Hsp20/alpha crystallin family protein [Haloarculaceae archaeon H-GB1-1]MEA5389359.1 archaeal heat shock protein Hsp14 [Haloarculaceae archaeon H-GB11]